MLRCVLVLVCAIAACDRSPSTSPGAAPVPSPAEDHPSTAQTTSLDPPVAPGARSPNLAATGDGALLTWLEPGEPGEAAAGTYRLRLATLSKGTWTAPSTITQGARMLANWIDVPSVVRQDDGTLVAHWAETTGRAGSHAYDVVLARSTDRGASWQRLGSPHRDGTETEHGFVSLLPDGDSVLAFWLDGRAMANRQPGSTALRFAHIRDTIGQEHAIDDRVCDCCSTSAAQTAEGPLVVYRDRTGDELRDPWLVRRAGDTWSAPHAVHADGWNIAGCPVNGPTVVAAQREVAIAWFTRAADRPTVRIAFSTDAGQRFDPPIEVDAARADQAPVGHVDAVMDRPGEVLVSWVAAGKGTSHLRVRRVARDRRRGGAIDLGTLPAAREGGVPRMERIGSDLVFAWSDPRAGVKVSRVALVQVPALPESGAPGSR